MEAMDFMDLSQSLASAQCWEAEPPPSTYAETLSISTSGEALPDSSRLETRTPPRRSNSLALEKGDCHLCIERGRKCDRRRWHCAVCGENGDVCRGYPVQLRWLNNARTQSKRSLKHTASATQTVKQTKSHPQPFRFVNYQKRQLQKGKDSGSSDGHAQKGASKQQVPSQHISQDGSINASAVDGSQDESSSSSVCLWPSSNGPVLEPAFHEPESAAQILEGGPSTEYPELASGVIPNVLLDSNAPQDLESLFSGVFAPHNLALSSFDTMAASLHDPFELDLSEGISRQIANESWTLLNVDKQHNEIPFIGGENEITHAAQDEMLYEVSLANSPLRQYDLTNLLNWYDRVYCILPMTTDMKTNPFRCKKETSMDSPYLLHAILALSIHHMARTTTPHAVNTETKNHRETAVTLYRNALMGQKVYAKGLNLLDTAIILFVLDATQSAFGNWNEHLERVLSVLEAFGEATALQLSTRVQAQVAMFMWWDTTVSLLSRKTRIIPSTYFEVLHEGAEENAWNFFDLVGCPSNLVAYLFEMSDLAAEFESTRNKKWTKFDHTRVLEIENDLRNWSGREYGCEYPDVDIDVDDDGLADRMHHQRDTYHCVEAWRNALLLYILRIFKTDELRSRKGTLSYLSRVILDHVRSCRRASYVQKQMLLPVYLAGCETSNQEAREIASEYCAWWNDKIGYGMFSSVGYFMDMLWARQDAEPDQHVWWGQIVDEKLSFHKQQIQFLLG